MDLLGKPSAHRRIAKCKAELESENPYPYSAYELKMSTLIKSVDEAEAAARELHDSRKGLEDTLAHGKT